MFVSSGMKCGGLGNYELFGYDIMSSNCKIPTHEIWNVLLNKFLAEFGASHLFASQNC